MTTQDYSYIGQLFMAASQLDPLNVKDIEQQQQAQPAVTKPLVQTKRANAKHVPFSHIPLQASENGRYIRLRLDISGVQDVKVNVERGGVLVVEGVRTKRCYEEDGVLKSHRFSRRYGMDTDVIDVNRIKASLSTKGVLTIIGLKRTPVVTDSDDDSIASSVPRTSLLGSVVSSEGGSMANRISPEKHAEKLGC